MFAKTKSFLFEQKNIRQIAMKNAFWLTVGAVVSKLLRAVIIIYAARVLGTNGYGIFSYVLSLAAFFTIFSDIGLTPLLIREVVKKPEQLNAYVSTTLVLKIIILTVTVFISIIFGPLLTKIPEAKRLIPVVALLLAFDSLRGFGFSVVRAQNRMELEALFSVITDVFITGLGIISLFLKPTPSTLAFSYTVGSGLGFLLVFLTVFKHHKTLLVYFDRKLIKPLISSAWPFAIMGLLGSFMINIDTIIIGWFRTPHELGLYGAAQRMVQVLYILPALLGTSLFPIISNLFQNGDHEKIRKITEQSLTFIFALALPLTVGGILLGGPLVQLFFGSAYRDAALTMQILLLTVLLIFPGALIGNTIFAYDKQKIFILSTALGAGANVLLDLLLIPPYGIAGSAVATVVSQILVITINWIKLRSINRFSLLSHLYIIFAASAIMGIIVIICQSFGVPLVANVFISGLLYFALLKIFREPLLSYLKLQ